jgi:hypothetical protein
LGALAATPLGPEIAPGFMLLSDAARQMYGKLGTCDLRDRIDAVGSPFPEMRISVTARLIAGLVDVFGTHPPSNGPEKIPRGDLEGSSLECLGSVLYAPPAAPGVPRSLQWANLTIRQKDFGTAAAHIMKNRNPGALEVR